MAENSAFPRVVGPHHNGIVGVLLAAGRGTRFDATGAQSKLLQPLPLQEGRSVAQAAALNLRVAVSQVIAVVRADDRVLAEQLAAAGCTLVRNDYADAGMGTSIACAVRATPNAAGWLIALADMPAVAPTTIAQIAAAIAKGATAAAPTYRGQRGHPVGFAASLGRQLALLDGDQGARGLLQAHPPLAIEVDDPGCLLDLDTPDDFAALLARPR
jgi:molybdenum cofactor cytidylyltransferase